jgi:hypothetical protein
MSDINPDPGNGPQDPALPGTLRFLKLLVTALAATMIAGLITIVTLLVIRLPHATAALPALPPAITLPEGARAEAVTFGRGWVAVVTDAGDLLVYDAASGVLRQSLHPGP